MKPHIFESDTKYEDNNINYSEENGTNNNRHCAKSTIGEIVILWLVLKVYPRLRYEVYDFNELCITCSSNLHQLFITDLSDNENDEVESIS